MAARRNNCIFQAAARVVLPLLFCALGSSAQSIIGRADSFERVLDLPDGLQEQKEENPGEILVARDVETALQQDSFGPHHGSAEGKSTAILGQGWKNPEPEGAEMATSEPAQGDDQQRSYIEEATGEFPGTEGQSRSFQEAAADEATEEEFPASFPVEGVQGHEADLPKVWKLHSLIKPKATQNTIIVIPANEGFLSMALNLRCRLLSLGSTNLLLWALDEKASRKLQEQGVPHYFDPDFYSVTEAVGYGVNNGNYTKMMSERPNFWWQVLATGFDMLFIDADVVAFGTPERALDRSADVEMQLDYQAYLDAGLAHSSNETSFCAGVLWIRSSLKALGWMDAVASTFDDQSERRLLKLEKWGHWDDQNALNYLLHDGERTAILNPTLSSLSNKKDRRTDFSPDVMTALYAHPSKVMGGTMLWQTTLVGVGYTTEFMYHYKGYQIKMQPVLLHLNGRGHEEKKKLIREHGWWLLDNADACSISQH